MTRPRGQILLVILSATLTGIMGNTLIAPSIPDILDDFDVGDGGAGLIIAATALPGVFLAPVIGLLADRYGRRNLLVPCMVLFGVAGLGVAAAPTFEVLLLARLGMGIGAAGLINLGVVLIGDHWDGADRTRLIGRNAAFLTAMVAVLPPIGGTIAQFAGWRVALLPYTLAIPFAVFAWWTLDDHRPGAGVGLGEQLRRAGDVIRQPSMIVVFAGGTLLFVLIFGAFLAAVPIHLEEEFGFEAGLRGAYLAIPAIPSTLAAFNLERLQVALGTRGILVASGLFLTVGFALMGTVQTAALFALGAFIYGFGEGATLPTLQNIAVSTASVDVRGAVMAVFISSTRLGQTIGPLGAAAIFEATSTSTALLVGAAIAAVLAMLFMFGPFRARPAG